MPLDLGPNLFGSGMAVAATPGDASTTVTHALNIRGAGTDARVQGDVDAALPGAERLAQDEGKSIYVQPQGQQWELDPVPSSRTPDAPATWSSRPRTMA